VNAPGIVALLVLTIGVPLNVYVTIRLWQAVWAAPRIKVLEERATASTIILLVVTVFGLIFINNDLIPPPFSFDTTKFATRLAMLALAIVPACRWLWLYRPTRGR
jgi:hypothetical protein